MTILEALDGIAAEVHSRHIRHKVAEIRENIESGYPLWRALEATHLFPMHAVSLIKIGEESGRLSENLRIVSLQQKKERVFRSRIRSAMMYPVFVLGLTLIIGVGIAWFILPKLATVFSQLKIKLPLITKVLIGTGTFLGEYGAIAVPLFLVALGVLVYMLFYFPPTKKAGQSMLFALPGVRRLILETELSRFGYLLGTLLGAGLPVTQALASLTEATSFPHYRRFYEYLTKSIEEGNSFEKSFHAYKGLRRLIPMPVQQLIISSERSGSLSNALVDISKSYEEKSETTTKDLTIILEPILLVIVWLGVVAVALAVILPIYSLVGGLQVSP